MIKLVASVVTVVVAVFTLHAKTVAWYHFDEGEIGTEAKGAVIINSVNPDSFKGKGESSWGKGDVYPLYTNSFPFNVNCYDPISGANLPNAKSLFFQNESRLTEGTGARSILKIDADASLKLKTFTVECFIKYAEDLVDVSTANRWCNLFTGFAGPSPAWGTDPKLVYRLYSGSANSLYFAFNTVTTAGDGVVTTNAYSKDCSAKGLLNGKWHHLAITFDDENKKAKVFYDYNQIYEVEYSGDLAYSATENGTVHIASTYGNSGAWNGCIDEFRISDEALTIDKFLRYDGMRFDTDTVCFVRFSNPENFGGTSDLQNPMNKVLGSYVNVSVGSHFHCNDSYVSQESDVSASTLRQNLFVADSVNNVGSICMIPDSAKGYWGRCIWVDDIVDSKHSALTNSWTMEFITKVPPFDSKGYDGNNRSAPYLLTILPNNGIGQICLSLSANKALGLTMHSTNRTVTVDTDGVAKTNVVTERFNNVGDFCNGQWHHVALTYDRSSLTASLYVDYVLKQSKVFNFDTTNENGDSSYGNGICLGNGWFPYGATTNYFDEFRLTTRALTVQEFLTSNPYVEVPYAAYIDFDGDCSVQPYETVTPSGVASGASITTAVGSSLLADEEGHQGRNNTGAMKIDDALGKVEFGRNLMIENLEDLTIEFFVKGEEGSDGNNIVNLTRSLTDGTAASRFWGISLSENSIAVYADTAEGANQGGKLGNVNVVDGKWHHVAVTFAKKGEAQTEVTVWIDYVQQSTVTIEGTLKADDFTTSALTFGGDGFKGSIDEFKVSPTIVPDTKFMRFYYAGTIIIVR